MAQPARRMVFHAPYPLNRAATSASGIRPVRMRDAFEQLGYEVVEVTGNAAERRRAIRRVLADLDAGARYDFCYSESSTMPTAMTEPNHLPLHPVMDLAFLARLRRHGVRVGLFYRDIYWRFDYGQGMNPAQKYAALAMYRFDLAAYADATDILYLPSELMAPHVDPRGRLTTAALPPGHDRDELPPVRPTHPLELVYVGGLASHYRLDPLVAALRELPQVHLTICTREDEWQRARESYEPVPANITVVHRSGEGLRELYEQANVAIMSTEPSAYRQFAMPVKFAEYIGNGLPVLATEGSLTGEVVARDGIGWVIPYTVEATRDLLQTLDAHPELLDAPTAAARAQSAASTWRTRAEQVARDLAPTGVGATRAGGAASEAAHSGDPATSAPDAGDAPSSAPADADAHPLRRVLLVGAARSIHTARWANALAGAGLEVHLATLHPAGDQHYDPRVRVHQLPRAKGAGYVLAAPALRRLVMRLRPDLVNTHYATGYGTLSTLALAGDTTPTLLSVWGADVYDVPLKSPVHEQVVRRNLAAATALASTSRAMARQTRRWVGPDKQIFLTPFGIDLDRFAQRTATDAARDEVVIGTVKTLHPKYGVDTLIEAFARARATRASLRLEIYGDGPQRAGLEALATRLGIGDDVTFHGQVPHDQVPSAMRSLDVYAALSRLDSESFGVAILEASASGVPVVVSDASGPAEVTHDGVTGFVVPRDDPDAAAAAIGRLADDPDLRARMGQAGREHVQETYTWQASVDSMLAAYRGTIALQREGRA